MKNKITVVLILFGIMSCSKNVDIVEMQAYLRNPENGLRHEFSEKGITYKLQYVPKDVMAYKETSNNQTTIEEVKKELADLEYFHLMINKEKSLQNENSKSSFYYAYQFEKDIYKLIDGDTLRPQLYLLEQGINGASSMSINLAFPAFYKDDEAITINDKYGFNTQFHLKKEDILNIPNLSF